MTRGRHTSGSTGSFYRDLVMMVIGIMLVGGAVFLLLYLFADDPNSTASGSTTSETSGTTATSVAAPTTTTEVPATSSSASTPTTVPMRPPSEVRVVVLNSIGLSGAAGRLTQRLADAGYQTQQADDYQPEQDPSRIWYREGFAAEANELLAFLPDALVELLAEPDLEEGSDVVLVLGIGYEE